MILTDFVLAGIALVCGTIITLVLALLTAFVLVLATCFYITLYLVYAPIIFVAILLDQFKRRKIR
jgi:predicted ABC-type sugar transport system permease subunit